MAKKTQPIPQPILEKANAEQLLSFLQKNIFIQYEFILTFGTDAYGSGGDKYYFSTQNKAIKALRAIIKKEGLRVDLSGYSFSGIEYHLEPIGDDNGDTIYAQITSIDLNTFSITNF